MQIDDNNVSLKRNLVEDISDKNYWITFSEGLKEVITKILSHLPFEDLLSFEAAAENHRNLTEANWKQLKTSKFFTFEWSGCHKDEFPSKHSFLLCKAIHAYIHRRFRCISLQENMSFHLQGIYQSFEGLMLHFPPFGACLWFDLICLSPFLNSPYKEIFEKNVNLLDLDENLHGGDWLLRSIHVINLIENDPSKINQIPKGLLFEKAIELNATFASYFALLRLSWNENLNWLTHLAELSSAKQDYRALDNLMFSNPNLADNYYNTGKNFPSVLAAMAFRLDVSNDESHNLGIEKRNFIFNAIDAYGSDFAPMALLSKIGQISVFNHRYDFSYTYKKFNIKSMFINSYDGYSDYDLRVSLQQFQFGHWKEAEKRYAQLQNLPVEHRLIKAYIKYRLNKWSEAEPIFDEVSNLDNNNTKIRIQEIYGAVTKDHNIKKYNKRYFNQFIFDYAYIKLKLKKYEDALKLYGKLLKNALENGDIVPEPMIWTTTELLKDIRSKCQEEEHVSLPMHFLYRYEIPTMFYHHQWNKVVELLNPIYSKLDLKNKIRLALAFYYLGNWKLAEPIYDELKNDKNLNRDYDYVINFTSGFEYSSFFEHYCEVDVGGLIAFKADFIKLKIRLNKIDEAKDACINTLSDIIASFDDLESDVELTIEFLEHISQGLEQNPFSSWISFLKQGEFESTSSPGLSFYFHVRSKFISHQWSEVIALLEPRLQILSKKETVFLAFSYFMSKKWQLAENLYTKIDDKSQYVIIDEISTRDSDYFNKTRERDVIFNFRQFYLYFDIVHIKVKLKKLDEALHTIRDAISELNEYGQHSLCTKFLQVIINEQQGKEDTDEFLRAISAIQKEIPM